MNAGLPGGAAQRALKEARTLRSGCRKPPHLHNYRQFGCCNVRCRSSARQKEHIAADSSETNLAHLHYFVIRDMTATKASFFAARFEALPLLCGGQPTIKSTIQHLKAHLMMRDVSWLHRGSVSSRIVSKLSPSNQHGKVCTNNFLFLIRYCFYPWWYEINSFAFLPFQWILKFDFILQHFTIEIFSHDLFHRAGFNHSSLQHNSITHVITNVYSIRMEEGLVGGEGFKLIWKLIQFANCWVARMLC